MFSFAASGSFPKKKKQSYVKVPYWLDEVDIFLKTDYATQMSLGTLEKYK